MDIKKKIDEKINSKKEKEINFLVEEEENVESLPKQEGTIDEKIIAFLSENPDPSDKELHAWAEGEGLNVHQVETAIYKLATKMVKFLTGGRAMDKGVTPKSVDKGELKMGIAVEKEHTPDDETAERIAIDHLSELPDYYTRLKKMESESEGEPKDEPAEETPDEEIPTEEPEEVNEGISLDNLKKFDKSRTQTAVKRTIDTLIELEDNDVFEGNEASYVRSVVSIMQKVSHKLKHNIIQ